MNTVPHPKAILFDLDGTLIDSIELIVRCFQHTVQTHLGYLIAREEILKYIGVPLRSELERLAPGRCEELIKTYREMQFGPEGDSIQLFPGVVEVLTKLHQRKIPLGIVTSKAKAGTEKAMELLHDLPGIFQVVVTVEDVANHKPHPEPLLFAAAQLKVAPENTWYVGDSHYDMRAANSAGMLPIGVTWGVGSRDQLSDFTHIVLDEPLELLAYLRVKDTRLESP